MRQILLSLILAPLLCLCFCGCDAGYLGHLVAGELELLAGTMPVEAALEDPSLSQEERDKLALAGLVRQFGVDAIGLYAGDSFTVFEPGSDQAAAYVLSASAKHRFASYQWAFPVVGVMTSKGFFDEAMGLAEAENLAAMGYDVIYSEAEGYSTLGFLPDPIRRSNLRLDDIDLTEFILHELTHNTLYKPSDNDFNEAMATFVGRAAALSFFESTFGANSAEAIAAAARFEDKGVIDEYVVMLYEEAGQYYDASAASGATPEEIVAGREAVFAASQARFATDYHPRLHDPDRWARVGEVEINNASILAGVRYQGGLSDFAAVLDKAGGDFQLALSVFEAASATSDSREYLRSWAADH